MRHHLPSIRAARDPRRAVAPGWQGTLSWQHAKRLTYESMDTPGLSTLGTTKRKDLNDMVEQGVGRQYAGSPGVWAGMLLLYRPHARLLAPPCKGLEDAQNSQLVLFQIQSE